MSEFIDINKIELVELVKPNTYNWGVKTINAHKVWNETEGENVKVAIIDTGIDMSHPDLKDNFKLGINMFNHTTDVTDEFGHGTHIAGIIAGNGKKGIKGVAPKSELYIAKVLDSQGIGSLVNVLDGITFAMNCEADILCMSLGIERELPLILKERITQAHNQGITIVCATGNSNSNINYPAYYDEVIAVGGVNQKLERAEFSNYGQQIDLVAPSTNILSTYSENRYAKLTGTSMASPFIAGAVALLISYHRKKGIELTPTEIKEMIVGSLNPEKDIYTGHGIINLAKLIKRKK